MTNGNIYSSPCVGPYTVYVGTYGDSVYAFDAATGARNWNFTTASFVYASPALSPAGDVLFVGSYDFSMYALSATTGALIWRYATGGQVRQACVHALRPCAVLVLYAMSSLAAQLSCMPHTQRRCRWTRLQRSSTGQSSSGVATRTSTRSTQPRGHCCGPSQQATKCTRRPPSPTVPCLSDPMTARCTHSTQQLAP